MARTGSRCRHAGDLDWLRDLPLPDEDGEPTPAGLLALPGSVAAELLDGDEIGLLHRDAVARWPREALVAVGVLDGLAAVAVEDPDLTDPPEVLADLDGFDDWADEVLRSGAVVGSVAAVRDLDVVRADRWPELVRHLASEPELRRALLEPVRVRTAERVTSAPSYTAWWLQRELGLAGTLAPPTAMRRRAGRPAEQRAGRRPAVAGATWTARCAPRSGWSTRPVLRRRRLPSSRSC